ncbi:MAG TPA: integrase core domain-containing protein [bacterium]|nr:integrase core domain-containing protein [bacterium]
MMDINGYWTFAYDSLNRPTSATDYDNKTISYSYMATGQRYQITDPGSGVTSYSYDGAGRLSKVKNPLNEETTYLHDYQSIKEGKEGLKTYFRFYNEERFHRSLNKKTPAAVYFGGKI